ncbi:MAG: ribose-phosphate pyrophosphokinase [Gemmatimonadota bacterium]|nr:ribose-phosphate pyrophosphokinase [Gemmatimonadota bacterium]
MTDDLRLFALETSRPLGEKMARSLGIALADHEEREFDDGEHKIRPLVNVRGRDVFVVHTLHGEPDASVNDKLCRLLFMLGGLRDAGAARMTAVVPYLCYARKDKRTKNYDPVTTRYVAALFEAVGVDRVVTMEVHNPAAFENAFRCGTDHVGGSPSLVRHVATHMSDEDLSVVSPDVGGVKRAEGFREALEERLGRPVGRAFMEKKRSAGVVSGDRLVGQVEGTRVVIVDDLIGTGTTIQRAAHACVEAGAAEVVAMATHGLFLEGAAEVVADPVLQRIVVTNTIPPFRLAPELVREKVEVVDVSGLLGEVVRRIHDGESLVDLMAE